MNSTQFDACNTIQIDQSQDKLDWPSFQIQIQISRYYTLLSYWMTIKSGLIFTYFHEEKRYVLLNLAL